MLKFTICSAMKCRFYFIRNIGDTIWTVLKYDNVDSCLDEFIALAETQIFY